MAKRKMSAHERAYRDFYGLSDDDIINDDDLVTFDPKNPPCEEDPCGSDYDFEYSDGTGTNLDKIVGTWIYTKDGEDDRAASYVIAVRKTKPEVLIVFLDWENDHEPFLREISPSIIVDYHAKTYGSHPLPKTVWDLSHELEVMNNKRIDMSVLDAIDEIKRRWVAGEGIKDILR